MADSRVDGLGELRRALAALPTQVDAAAAAAVAAAGAAVRTDIRAHIAFHTGEASADVEVRQDGADVEVGIFDPESAYIEFPEFGTSSQQEQPSFRPAAEAERGRLARRVAEHVRRAVE